MPDLPPPPSLDALRDEAPLALFLDFDGTLVDLAQTPDSIIVPEGLSEDLHALHRRLGGRMAVVSGRGIVDVEKHLGPLSVPCAGSHGSDIRAADGTPIGEVPGSLAPAVLEAVATFARQKGFRLEDKPHGTALHYRADPSLEDEGVRFAEDLAARHDLTVKRGKCVIELVALGSDKGTALRSLMETEPFAGTTPVFVGDDITDEDGMVAATELGGFGIIVGDRRPTCAKYGLASPAAVHQWLGL